MANQGKQYSAQFKQDAVNHYLSSGKTLNQTAKDLRISKSALGKWVREAKQNDGEINHRGSGNHSSDAEKEIAKLKRELRDTKDALDILKKAMGILSN